MAGTRPARRAGGCDPARLPARMQNSEQDRGQGRRAHRPAAHRGRRGPNRAVPMRTSVAPSSMASRNRPTCPWKACRSLPRLRADLLEERTQQRERGTDPRLVVAERSHGHEPSHAQVGEPRSPPGPRSSSSRERKPDLDASPLVFSSRSTSMTGRARRSAHPAPPPSRLCRWTGRRRRWPPPCGPCSSAGAR